MAGLDLNVADEQARPDTRATRPTNRVVGVPGFDGYGHQPMFNRLPIRGLSAFDLSTLDYLELDPFAAIELLPYLFPQASLAVHNILRLGNPGWEIFCFHAVTGTEDKRGARLCAEMMERANRGVDCQIPGAMGGPDALVNSLLFNAYLKGAVCVETVLREDFADLEDIVAVDPFSILFEEREEKRGRYRIYQMQSHAGDPLVSGKKLVAPVPTMPSNPAGYLLEGKVELNPNLLTYVPLDETLYGRSMIAPAIQLLVFWTRFYVALQVFLHNVAFGDKDGEIDTNLLLTLLDRNIPQAERAKWNRNFWKELIKVVGIFAADYKEQQKRAPNDALIHSDLLKMSALGTARTAYPVKEIMEVFSREIYAALKMLPVLMGANDSTTETQATVQMQIFASGLNYIQGAVRHAIERALLTGLRAQGYPRNVRVEFRFRTVSLEDRKRAAEAIAAEIANEVEKRNQGFQTQDDASEAVTGSAAVEDSPQGHPAKNPLFVRDENDETTVPDEGGADEKDEDGAEKKDEEKDEGAPKKKGARRVVRSRARRVGAAQLALVLPDGSVVPATSVAAGNAALFSVNSPNAIPARPGGS